MKPLIIFILGPTSSGKSAVASILAEKLKGEVISCDSMQVYRDMDIITQAPREEMTIRAPHHLIRSLSPEEEFSAARFAEEARRNVEEIVSRGNVPVFAGGTGLYVRTLVDGIFEGPSKDEEVRSRLEKEAAEAGTEALHARLREIDPATAGKLHANDKRRIIRALEVWEACGVTMSEMKSRSAGKGIGATSDCRFFGLDVPREDLYSRIDAAVERMFDEGLVAEVKKLMGTRLSRTASQALGIREVSAYLGGIFTLEEAARELKKNTRNYAKRQLTWFRADKRIVWVNAERSAEEIAEEIAADIGG